MDIKELKRIFFIYLERKARGGLRRPLVMLFATSGVATLVTQNFVIINWLLLLANKYFFDGIETLPSFPNDISYLPAFVLIVFAVLIYYIKPNFEEQIGGYLLSALDTVKKGKKAKTLIKTNNSLGWGCTKAELAETLHFFNIVNNKIEGLPAEVRSILRILLDSLISSANTKLRYFPTSIDEAVFNRLTSNIADNVSIESIRFLIQADLAYYDDDEFPHKLGLLRINGEDFWEWVVEYCHRENIDTNALIDDNNFGLFD